MSEDQVETEVQDDPAFEPPVNPDVEDETEVEIQTETEVEIQTETEVELQFENGSKISYPSDPAPYLGLPNPETEVQAETETEPPAETEVEPEPETDPADSAELASYKTWHDAARQIAEEVQEAHSEYLESAENTKRLKKRWEAEAERLQEFVLKPPEQLPLFDAPRPAPRPAPANSQPGPAPIEAPKAPEVPEDESWKTQGIEVLKLSKGLEEKLKSADLETIGKITLYTQSGKALSDIKGVGESAIEKIADAIEKFFAERANPPTEASE